MFTFTRTTLTALALAASVTMAQAQTSSAQDGAQHHPQASGNEQTQALSPMPMGGPEDGVGMMGAEMGQMMRMMGGMMGSMAGGGGGNPSTDEERARMGAMMQSMGQMMANMGRMMGPQGMGGRMGPPDAGSSEQRIASLKAALGITEAQTPQWTAFANALRSGEQKVRSAFMETRQVGIPASAPDRAELRVRVLSVMLDALKTTVAAEKSLYGVLSTDQKRTADQLLSGPFGRR